MSNNKNKNEKHIKFCRLFVCKDGNILIMFLEPNKGFKHMVVKAIKNPATSEIIEVQQVSADHNMTFKSAEELLKTFWPNAKLTSLTLLTSYRPELLQDGSKALLNYGLEILSLDHIDPNDNTKQRTFKDHLFNIAQVYLTPDGGKTLGIELDEFDNSSNLYTPVAYDYKSDEKWKAIPKQIRGQFIAPEDDALAKSISSLPVYQRMLRHCLYPTPSVNDRNLLAFGPPGGGKTNAFARLAQDLHLPFVSFTATSDMDREEMFGSITPDIENSGWKQQLTLFTTGIQVGCVALIDEFLLLKGSYQSSLNTTVSGNNRYFTFQGLTYKVHPDTIFCVASNLGLAGCDIINTSFESRFYPYYFDRLPAEIYGNYQAEVWGQSEYKLQPDTIKDYVKFTYDLMDYIEERCKDADQYKPQTPNITTRHIPHILKNALTRGSLKDEVFDVLTATLSGCEEFRILAASIVAEFEPQIEDLELKLFQSEETLKDIEKAYQDFLSWGVPPEPEKDAKDFYGEAEAEFATKFGGGNVS